MSKEHHAPSSQKSFFSSRNFKVIYRRKIFSFFQKNYKFILLLLLLPLFILVLFLLGKLPLGNTKHNETAQKPQSSVWNKYTNNKYKYSFEYPPEWKLDTSNPAVVFLKKDSSRITFFDTGFKASETSDASKITGDFINRNGLKKGGDKTVGNKKGIVALKDPDSKDKKWYEYIFMPVNNTLFGMQLETPELSSKDEFNKILSTFKFE